MTATEVARHLQVNVETVYLLIQRDHLPAAKIGRQWRFEEEEVTRWLHAKMRHRSLANGLDDRKNIEHKKETPDGPTL